VGGMGDWTWLQDWRLARANERCTGTETERTRRRGAEVERSLQLRAVVRLRFCARGEGRWVLLNKRASMRDSCPNQRGRSRREVGEGQGVALQSGSQRSAASTVGFRQPRDGLVALSLFVCLSLSVSVCLCLSLSLSLSLSSSR